MTCARGGGGARDLAVPDGPRLPWFEHECLGEDESQDL